MPNNQRGEFPPGITAGGDGGGKTYDLFGWHLVAVFQEEPGSTIINAKTKNLEAVIGSVVHVVEIDFQDFPRHEEPSR